MTLGAGVLLAAALAWLAVPAAAESGSTVPQHWKSAWPETDFSRHAVDLASIQSGGPPKDGIPSIDDPTFVSVSEAAADMADTEPVIGLSINGDARAYPLRILMWHEIANDVVGGVPVAVTYCPLCNAAIVFERTVDGRVLEFGTTGKLRYSDLVMYDRQTESWWQQFTGEAIVGEMTGTALDFVPARLESWAKFKGRHPDGKVLVPTNPRMRPYGRNPYAGYDSQSQPFLYSGELPEKVPAMARVVAVGKEAWSLDLLRERKRVERGDLVITWEPGQNSALDTREIAEGRDVGNVVVRRRTADGLEDVPYDVTFAFVFRAFRPDGALHTLNDAS